MKLAIIGSSPVALEAALRFHTHEAALTWFNSDSLVSSDLLYPADMQWEECTTELGWNLLKKSGATAFKKEVLSFEKWKNHYYLPLMELLKLEQNVKPHAVLSVTKRFLAPSEEIEGKSRFHDLFRIIYQLNPEEFINEQKLADPETYERLSKELMQSLQSSLEMYEDFDLVFDFREETTPDSIAISGRALGEGRVGKDKVSYGFEALKKSRSMKPSPDLRELSLVGSGDVAAQIVLALEEWLMEPRSRLFLISHEEEPFRDFFEKGKTTLTSKLNSLIKKMEDEFQHDVNEFHKKLREWQQLDDFVQVKIPKPVEPIPRLVFFSGHNVTAIDQLIDRKRLFITLEKPEFRKGLRHPENNHLDLKTLGVDEVLVANNLVRDPLNEYLHKPESGFFEIAPKRASFKDGWKEDLNALDGIEKEVFLLFSPADSH
jgi:hypothetical protein